MNTKGLKNALLFLFLLFTANTLWAQDDYSYYLEWARTHLKNGDCIRASIHYDVYKEMTHKRVSEIERQIEECKSGNISSSGESLFGDALEQVDDEIISKVKIFQRYVNNLASNSFTHQEKEDRYQMALDLFVNRCEPYNIIVPYRDGERIEKHDATQMCVITSKNTQKRKYYPMKQYLRNLIHNSENPDYRYKKVVIESSDVIRIDNYIKVGDGKYMALAHYVQKYSAYQSADLNKVSYMDYTPKTIAIYIDVMEINQPDGNTENYIRVLLGDVDCEGEAW